MFRIFLASEHPSQQEKSLRRNQRCTFESGHMPFNYISMANCCQTAYETLRILSTRLRSAGGVYLSGGLKPATEIKRPRHLPGPAYARYVNYFVQLNAASYLSFSGFMSAYDQFDRIDQYILIRRLHKILVHPRKEGKLFLCLRGIG